MDSLSWHRIAERRDAVISRRKKVMAASIDRAKQLQDSLTWQQFCRDADEVVERSAIMIMSHTALYIYTHVYLFSAG